MDYIAEKPTQQLLCKKLPEQKEHIGRVSSDDNKVDFSCWPHLQRELQLSHEGVSEVNKRARERSVAKQSTAERVSGVSEQT